MHRRPMQIACCLLTAALLVATVAPAAEAASFFTARRTFGVLFLGCSALMAKKAIDYKRDADDIYNAYKVANNADEAQSLYDRASDRDTKSQMSIGLSAILLVSGLRLMLHSGIDNNIPKLDRRIKLDMTSDVQKQSVGIALKKRF